MFWKRTSPLSAERWIKRQTWLTIGVFLLVGILHTIFNDMSAFYYFGLLIIVLAFLFNIFFIRFNIEDAYNLYVATFNKDKTVTIARGVLQASYVRDIVLVTGVILVFVGLFFSFPNPYSSIEQQDMFGGEPAPSGYTWVVFNPRNQVPEGRKVTLRTGVRRQPVYFPVEKVWQGNIGFLVPESQLNMRNVTILLVPLEEA